jgi:endoglucanase
VALRLVSQDTPARTATLVSSPPPTLQQRINNEKDYSQCLPGTATSTKTTSSGGATSTGGSSPPKSTTLPFLGGVNTAGYDFTVSTDGSFTGTGVSPPTSQYQHFASEGVNIFRIPFAWQLMTPTLGGTVSSSFLSKYDATVNAAQSSSTSPYVIVDLHSSYFVTFSCGATRC